MARDRGGEPVVETTEWDPLCRIDVVDLDDEMCERMGVCKI